MSQLDYLTTTVELKFQTVQLPKKKEFQCEMSMQTFYRRNDYLCR